MSVALARREEPSPVQLSGPDLELLKATVARGATDEELRLFAATARRMSLDPFAHQLAFTKRRDRRLGRDVVVIIVEIDGLRLLAHRSGRYAGQRGPEWAGPDGRWREVWLEDEPPAAARVAVLRSDFVEPLWGIVTWRSFVQIDGGGRPTGNWRSMPDVMLAKAAERQALRRAFPAETTLDAPGPAAGEVVAGELGVGVDEPVSEPLGPDEPAPGDQDAPMTEPQRRALMAACGERGMDRPARLRWAARILERSIGTFAALTRGEARRLLEALAARNPEVTTDADPEPPASEDEPGPPDADPQPEPQPEPQSEPEPQPERPAAETEADVDEAATPEQWARAERLLSTEGAVLRAVADRFELNTRHLEAQDVSRAQLAAVILSAMEAS